MNAPLYTTEILRLAASLPEPAELDRVDGRAERRSSTCGSRVAAAVMVSSGGRVAAIAQQVHACAFGQASAALLARHAVGRSRDEVAEGLAALEAWLRGSDGDVSAWGLEALAPARQRRSRHGAILLPFQALLAAMDER